MLFFVKLESTENFAINNFAPVFDWFFFLLDDSGHVVRVSNDFFPPTFLCWSNSKEHFHDSLWSGFVGQLSCSNTQTVDGTG